MVKLSIITLIGRIYDNYTLNIITRLNMAYMFRKFDINHLQ